ncbi:hypothetical protein ACO2Q8_25555 [Larkinella sp. VNQ87]|uniref:hypothetical protein n=1 Tax=Larkinella sp. VNQ87 TaxID=3400921 RepID=UPI003C01BEC7
MDHTQAKTAAVWLAILSLLFLGTSIYYWDKSTDLNNAKNKTELRADSLLSAKLDLERNIKQVKEDLNARLTEANTLNDQLEERVESTQNRLQARDNQLGKLRRQNAANISELQAQLAQLESTRNEIQSELTQVKAQNQQSLAANANLKNTATLLEEKNKALGTELATTKALITVDNFRVDILKPNHKLTAKAKKTDELQISFTMPPLWQTDDNETVYVSLTDLKNTPIQGALRTETIHVGDATLQIPVHAVKTVNAANGPQKVTINYTPVDKMDSGTYKVRIYTNDGYLGATEFGLRNSFWFF